MSNLKALTRELIAEFEKELKEHSFIDDSDMVEDFFLKKSNRVNS